MQQVRQRATHIKVQKTPSSSSAVAEGTFADGMVCNGCCDFCRPRMATAQVWSSRFEQVATACWQMLLMELQVLASSSRCHSCMHRSSACWQEKHSARWQRKLSEAPDIFRPTAYGQCSGCALCLRLRAPGQQRKTRSCIAAGTAKPWQPAPSRVGLGPHGALVSPVWQHCTCRRADWLQRRQAARSTRRSAPALSCQSATKPILNPKP